MRTLVTGANGFIGQALCQHLHQKEMQVIGASRTEAHSCKLFPRINIGEIDKFTNWSHHLKGVNSVVHLAARVHFMNQVSSDKINDYLIINTEGTLHLAKQAAEAGVKRFIFISTVKVNGEETKGVFTKNNLKSVFSHDDEPAPSDLYATSKWLAENGLKEIAKKTGMEIVIIRPPLVYGPRVRANFLRLLKIIDFGLPLPFGLVQNKRSMIYIGNLVDAIETCLSHSKAAGKTYLLSDGEDLSIPDLVRDLAALLDKSSRLINIKPELIMAFGKLLGKEKEIRRLLGSLVINSEPIQNDLGWSPPFTLDAGLAATVNWYLQNIKK